MAFTSQANASDLNVKCVQNQLNASGIKIGDVNEVMNQSTKDGVTGLISQYPSLGELKPITQDNAIAWCHEIGLMNEDLKRYWPTSNDEYFEFIFADGFNARELNLLTDFATKARDNLKKIDIELAGKLKIIVGRKAESLARMTQIHRRYPRPIEYERNATKNACNPGRAGGYSEDSFFVVCIDERFDYNLRRKRRLQQLMVHEITHEAQRQISGYLPQRVTKDTLLESYGPHWLIEGTATAMVEIFIAPKNVSANAHVKNRRNWQDYTTEILQSYEQHIWPTPSQLYRHGTYATHLLATKFTDLENQKTGHEVFTTYWRQLARNDWKIAFKNAFGLSAEEFYVEFK